MAFLTTLFIVLGVLLSACSLLVPLKEIPVTGEFGPVYSTQDRQTRTFEALWKHIEDSYVYYDTAKVDWKALHDKVQARIDSGLSDDEFASLMKDLEKELPAGSLTYQSRAERIQADMTDTSSYEGIGAFIGFQAKSKPHIVILDVIQGPPAEKAGLRIENGIVVNDLLQTSNPDIFAAGDNAFFPSRALGRPVRIEHWDNAVSQGKWAGQNMAGELRPFTYLPYFFSDLFEFGFEAVGDTDATLDTFGDWQKENDTGVIYYLKEGKVRGVMLCNVWGKVDAARALIERGERVTPASLRGTIR